MADTTTGFYIMPGWVSRQRLLTEGYKINNLPIQSDMTGGRRWLRPGNESDLVRPARLVDTITGYRHAYGGVVFTWSLLGLSPKMIQYLKTTIFHDRWSGKFTVQTFNRTTGNWECYWVIGRFPNYAEEAELLAGGLSNFKISFVNGVFAPEGAELAPVLSVDVNETTVGQSVTFQVTATNNGDANTFTSTVITYVVPDDWDFVSGFWDGWVAEWSADGTTYTAYNDAPPDPNASARYWRFIYTSILEPNETAPLITVEVVPNEPGDTTHTFTVTINGESESAQENISVTEGEGEEEE